MCQYVLVLQLTKNFLHTEILCFSTSHYYNLTMSTMYTICCFTSVWHLTSSHPQTPCSRDLWSTPENHAILLLCLQSGTSAWPPLWHGQLALKVEFWHLGSEMVFTFCTFPKFMYTAYNTITLWLSQSPSSLLAYPALCKAQRILTPEHFQRSLSFSCEEVTAGSMTCILLNH
jgi:hypothetical protein